MQASFVAEIFVFFVVMLGEFGGVAVIQSKVGDAVDSGGGAIRASKFRRARGRSLLTSDPPLTLGYTRRASYCLTWCLAHPSCASVSYLSREGLCHGHNTSVGEIGNQLQNNSQWDFYAPWPSDVRMGEWVMVFRAQRDLNLSIGDSYNDKGVTQDGDLLHLDPIYYSLNIDGVPGSHYRSRYLDQWRGTNIQQVRLSLYTNGSEVLKMIFNGINSNSTSWFSEERVLSSPWTDLQNESKDVFSLNGTELPGIARRFYISKSINQVVPCIPTTGWLLVTDLATLFCRFEKTTTFPTFLYAKGTQFVDFASEYRKTDKGLNGYADVLAVFIKLG